MNLPLNKLKTFLLYLTVFFVGCYGTSKIAELTTVSVIAIGCLITLVSSYSKFMSQRKLDSLIYCASFAGMCSSYVLKTPIDFLIVSIFGALIFNAFKNHFIGIGGKLGTMAFLSVALFVLTRSAAW